MLTFSEAQKKKADLERQLQEESEPKLNLDSSQMTKYRQLKNDVEKQTADANTKLYDLEQEQEGDRASVVHETRRKEQFDVKIKEVMCI